MFSSKFTNKSLFYDKILKGNLVERIRSGAMGVRAFYTTTGANTYVETGGFPVRYNTKTKAVAEYSKPKEVLK